MQYLPFLLLILACPLGMGAMMWFTMREKKAPSSAPISDLPTLRQEERRDLWEETRSSSAAMMPRQPQPSPFKAIGDCIQMCLNWRVLVGLVVVAALLGVLNPTLLVTALPILLILACPLSMGIMMLRPGKMRQNTSPGGTGCVACQPDQVNRAASMQPHQEFEQPLLEHSRPSRSEIATYE